MADTITVTSLATSRREPRLYGIINGKAGTIELRESGIRKIKISRRIEVIMMLNLRYRRTSKNMRQLPESRRANSLTGKEREGHKN